MVTKKTVFILKLITITDVPNVNMASSLGIGNGDSCARRGEQILTIDPPVKLTITGPFDKDVFSVISLTNPSNNKVWFRIEGTLALKYSLNTKCGLIDPKQTVKIEIRFFPFHYDPLAKNEFDFMVWSMFVRPGEVEIPPKKQWNKSRAFERMVTELGCVFLMPELNGGVNKAIPGNHDSTQTAVDRYQTYIKCYIYSKLLCLTGLIFANYSKIDHFLL